MTRTYWVQPVLEYLKQNIGVHVTIHEVTEAVGHTEPGTANVLARMARDPQIGLRRVERGIYIYQPGQPAEKSLIVGQYYEAVGQTTDKRIIVRDEKGTLYALGDAI